VGAAARAEFGHQLGQGVRAAPVTQDDVVPGCDREAGDGAADHAAADQADGAHVGDSFRSWNEVVE